MNWSQNLSVGVDSIDNQHKIWFDKANALFDACAQGKGKAYISELFTFLEEYTKTHFTDEESYMQKINYPKYQAQKMLHQNFITQLDKLEKDFSVSGGNLSVVIGANKLLLDWFVHHISVEDKQIGVFAEGLKK